MHECIHVKEIDKLIHAIEGNGKVGLKTEVELLKSKFESMEENLESLATSFKALAKSQIEYDTTQKLKANTWRQIALIMGIAIPLTALILKLG